MVFQCFDKTPEPGDEEPPFLEVCCSESIHLFSKALPAKNRFLIVICQTWRRLFILGEIDSQFSRN